MGDREQHRGPTIWRSSVLTDALALGADCAIGVSGGKDSQALLATVVPWLWAQGYPGTITAIFADLGRAEWPQTRPFLTDLCRTFQVKLVTVQRSQGDLLDLIEQRRATLGDTAPFWPSSAARYCTSTCKREPINHHLRGSPLVCSIEGIRAQESDARAAKQPLSVRKAITGTRYQDLTVDAAWACYRRDRDEAACIPSLFGDASEPPTLPRLAFTWYPLFYWSVEDVWQACGTSLADLEERRRCYQEGIVTQDATLREQALVGWPAHPAYVMGARRLACKLCGI